MGARVNVPKLAAGGWVGPLVNAPKDQSVGARVKRPIVNTEGVPVGAVVVGDSVAKLVGSSVGTVVGFSVVGPSVGLFVGACVVGSSVGTGTFVGPRVRDIVRAEGSSVGSVVGPTVVGAIVGATVGAGEMGAGVGRGDTVGGRCFLGLYARSGSPRMPMRVGASVGVSTAELSNTSSSSRFLSDTEASCCAVTAIVPLSTNRTTRHAFAI